MYLKPQNGTINGDLRLAVLIDADNVSSQYLNALMNEVARFGNTTIKRIYGDWTRPSLNAWKGLLLNHAIHPVQQFGYTQGKNSTDSALIIDAMDLLYSGICDGFALVSSDSDFTRLAMRLREAGMIVYGFGERKTPNAFTAACDRFIYLEVLTQPKKTIMRKPWFNERADESVAPIPNGEPGALPREIIELVDSTIADLEDENGWAFLGAVGNLINKKLPSFDTRTYGFAKLVDLISSSDRFEVKYVSNASDSAKIVYIRLAAKTNPRENDFSETKEPSPKVVPKESPKETYKDSYKEPTKEPIKPSVDTQLLTDIAESIEQTIQSTGWSNLSNSCEVLRKIRPDFDPRNYGYSKTSSLFESLSGIELRISKTPGEQSSTIAVRCGENLKKLLKKPAVAPEEIASDTSLTNTESVPVVAKETTPEPKPSTTPAANKKPKTKSAQVETVTAELITQKASAPKKTSSKSKTSTSTKTEAKSAQDKQKATPKKATKTTNASKTTTTGKAVPSNVVVQIAPEPKLEKPTKTKSTKASKPTKTEKPAAKAKQDGSTQTKKAVAKTSTDSKPRKTATPTAATKASKTVKKVKETK